MKANYGFLPLCAAFLAAPCLAQTAPAAVQPRTTAEAVAVLDAPAPASVLRAGTEVPLLLREELTTKEKKLRVGQRVQMEVGSNVSVNGIVVIPAGTPAIGEITEVRNKACGANRVISVRACCRCAWGTAMSG